MTVADAIVQIRDLCQTNSEAGIFANEKILAYLNMCQRRVWRSLVERAPERFLVEETIVPEWTRDRFNYRDAKDSPFTSLPLSFFGVWLVTGGVGGTTETRESIPYSAPKDMPQQFSTAPLYQGDMRWTTIGDDFVVRATPQAGTSMVFLYMPDMVDLTYPEGEGELGIFGGKWEEFHDIVTVRTAAMLMQAAGEQNQALAVLEAQMWDEVLFLTTPQRVQPIRAKRYRY